MFKKPEKNQFSMVWDNPFHLSHLLLIRWKAIENINTAPRKKHIERITFFKTLHKLMWKTQKKTSLHSISSKKRTRHKKDIYVWNKCKRHISVAVVVESVRRLTAVCNLTHSPWAMYMETVRFGFRYELCNKNVNNYKKVSEKSVHCESYARRVRERTAMKNITAYLGKSFKVWH